MSRNHYSLFFAFHETRPEGDICLKQIKMVIWTGIKFEWLGTERNMGKLKGNPSKPREYSPIMSNTCHKKATWLTMVFNY